MALHIMASMAVKQSIHYLGSCLAIKVVNAAIKQTRRAALLIESGKGAHNSISTAVRSAGIFGTCVNTMKERKSNFALL